MKPNQALEVSYHADSLLLYLKNSFTFSMPEVANAPR